MPPRWPLLLGLLVLTATPPLRADTTAARDIIASCIERVDPGVRGLADLARACPGIEQAASAIAPGALLPNGWRKQVTAQGLADLAALAERYAGSPASVRPDEARLRAIAAQLRAPPLPSSWWGRVQFLIRKWLGPASSALLEWLRSFRGLRSGASIMRLLAVGAIGLVLIAAAFLIAFELRAAGLINRKRRTPSGTQRGRVVSAPRAEQRTPDLAALDSAPEEARPVLLLQILIAALAKAHRLERDRGLTCRELAAYARFDTPLQRERFTSVALLAEEATYGPPAPPATIPREVLSAARTLCAELAAS